MFGGRLTSTVALYRLTKENILSTDPTNPLARVPIGEARSRGIELDLSGQFTDRWSVIGSYAYTDTRITEDTLGGNQGHRSYFHDQETALYTALHFGCKAYLSGWR